MKLSIIIPAFNEEDRIVRTLENTLFYLKKQKYKAEVIVISDGSTDRTKEVVENFKSKEKISSESWKRICCAFRNAAWRW